MSLKKAQERYDQSVINLKQAKVEEQKALENLNKAKSNIKFKCQCGQSTKYKDLTLVRWFWTEKGLGYSDDVEHFGEYKIKCHCGNEHRFLTDETMDKFEIPYEVKDHYGKPKRFNKIDYNFQKKFGKVVDKNR